MRRFFLSDPDCRPLQPGRLPVIGLIGPRGWTFRWRSDTLRQADKHRIMTAMPPDLPSSADTPTGLDPSRLDIETRQPTLEEVLKRIGDGECEIGPWVRSDIETGVGASDAWTATAKSRLIESILIRVPLPTFYVDAADEERWVVIDGRRRLAAISEFVLEKAFPLTGLEYLTELEGQGYDELARALKRRLGETQITVELIKPGTPAAIRYNLFRRLNRDRPAQSVREAVLRGAAIELIDRLAESDAYRAFIPEGATDREAILRFLSFFPMAHPPVFDPPLENFLNGSLESLNDETLDGMIYRHLLEQRFLAAMITAAALFDGNAFRVPTDAEEGGEMDARPVDPALFETWSVCLARLGPAETERLLARREEVIKAFTELLHDHGFAAATAPGTDDPDSVRARFTAIHDLVGQFVSA